MKRLISWGLAGVLVIAAIGLAYLAYRRMGTPVQLVRGAVVVDGVITEKLVQQERLSPLPIEANAYVVRYAFPNPQGQMRISQQTVTGGFFRRVGDQGTPIAVSLYPENTGTNAVETQISFPGVAGWRLGAAGMCLLLAYIALLIGVPSRQKQPG